MRATANNPPIDPRLLPAFTQNGAAIPNATVVRTPKAGPTARLTLTPTPFAATASRQVLPGDKPKYDRRHRGAVSGAGLDEERSEQQPARRDQVQPDERRKRGGRYQDGVTDDDQQAPLVNDVRQRTRQQREQEGRQARLPGPAPAKLRADSESRVAISYAEAALYIQPPISETTVAVHMTVNVQ